MATTYLIPWTGKMFPLKRIVLADSSPDEHTSAMHMIIQTIACQLGIPVVYDDQDLLPAAGDLWIGDTPSSGWGDLFGDCAWARSAELPMIPLKLMKTRLDLEYVKEFLPGSEGCPGIHVIGASLATHYGSRTDFIRSLIAVARDTYPDLPDGTFEVCRASTSNLHGTTCITFSMESVTDTIPEGYTPISRATFG
jgi:hypothetical protein